MPPWFRQLMQTDVYVQRMRFDIGLDVRIGDIVWLLPSGIATNKKPHGGKVNSLLCKLGLRRRPLVLYVGTVVSSDRYHIDGTCEVLVT